MLRATSACALGLPLQRIAHPLVAHVPLCPCAEQPSVAEKATVLNAQVDTLGDGAAILTCTRLNQVAGNRSVIVCVHNGTVCLMTAN